MITVTRNRLFVLLCSLLFSLHAWAVCPGDLDESGTVEVPDVLGLLSMFGCELDCGGADLDGDGAVGSSDVLLVKVTLVKVVKRMAQVFDQSNL